MSGSGWQTVDEMRTVDERTRNRNHENPAEPG